MPGHDAEEFGGELYHDIVARTERSWGIWLDILRRVDESDAVVADLARALMDATSRDDETAIETIRALLEGSTEMTVATPARVVGGASLPAAREAMVAHHDRLLGAIEAASQASNDILEQVRLRIAALTWQQYEDRATRLGHSIAARET